MLGGAEGIASHGSPATKFADSCIAGSTRYRPLKYAGYWPDPYPYNGQTGTYRRSCSAQGPLPAAVETGAAVAGGSGSPINNSRSENCGGDTAPKTTSQSLGVSEVVITELPR